MQFLILFTAKRFPSNEIYRQLNLELKRERKKGQGRQEKERKRGREGWDRGERKEGWKEGKKKKYLGKEKPQAW